MAHIIDAQVRRQGDQRGAVVERPATGHLFGTQLEEVAEDDLHIAMPVYRHLSLAIHLGLDALGGEEILHRPLRQLHAQHPLAAPGQPEQIETLAAQRHQHLRPGLDAEGRPVLPEVGVDLILVKTDLVARPALLPELFVHDCPHRDIRERAARCGPRQDIRRMAG
ncbi:hypothetical protein D9M71_171530 [compost metagenome]